MPSKGAGHLRFGNSLAGPTGKLKPWQLLQEGSESPITAIDSAWFPTQYFNISPIIAPPTFGWSWSCRWRLAAATSPTSWLSPSLAAASNEAAWGWAGCTRWCFFSSFYMRSWRCCSFRENTSLLRELMACCLRRRGSWRRRRRWRTRRTRRSRRRRRLRPPHLLLQTLTWIEKALLCLTLLIEP